MQRPALLALAGLLLVVGLTSLAWQIGSSPTTLRVAVGPSGSEDARLIAAMGAALSRERETIRLQIVATRGPSDSARALDDGKADLAVVRTDIAMPEKGQTVAIMHRDVVLLLAAPGNGIATVPDLRGRTVGIVRDAAANGRVLDALLAFYDVPRTEVSVIPLAGASEVEQALRAKRVDVVLAIGTLSGRTVTETFAAAAAASGGASPVIVPVPEAEAIAQRSAIFETFEIVRGAFGGSMARPAEAVRTLGVNHRLVAAASQEEEHMSELARLIFALRPRVAAEVPLANRIEAPDTSKSSSLPVHPGAAAYYDGEVQTFFERYSDWIYVGIMVLSILGSCFAGFASTVAARRRTRTLGYLGRLTELMAEARRAEDAHELDEIEREADSILGVALDRAGTGSLDAAAVAAFSLGLDQLREAIDARRATLADPRAAPLRIAAE